MMVPAGRGVQARSPIKHFIRHVMNDCHRPRDKGRYW